MADAKQAHALVSYFIKQFKEKYDRKAPVNRYSARWVMESILEDYSYDEGCELIDYYFTTASPNGHSLEYFQYNYEKLAETMDAVKQDRAALALVREESKRRVAEWKEKNGIND